MRPSQLRARASVSTAMRLVSATLVASALCAGFAAAPAAAAPSEPGEPSPAAAATVLVGVSGLRWSDIDAQGTPTLWDLVGAGSVGSISVRTVNPVTCPIDAWLTLSAGQRALGSPSEPVTSGRESTAGVPTSGPSAGEACPPIPRVSDGRVVGWRSFVRLQRSELGSYGEPGVLGDGLRRDNVCSQAVGPGAAVALATSAGRIELYTDHLAGVELGGCPVTVVDGGSLPVRRADRLSALHRLDSQLAGLVSRLPAPSQLLVAGVADVPGVHPGLQVIIEASVPTAGRTWLTSNSTRRAGLVQLTDLTATLLSRAGVAGQAVDGAPLLHGEPRRLDTSATIRNRLDVAVLTEVSPAIAPWLAALYVLVLGIPATLAALDQRRRRARAERPTMTPGWRRGLTVLALAAAATPVATYLATLTSWWTAPAPAFTLVGAVLGIVAAVTLLAWWPPAARLRREVWGPAAVVSGVTFVVLTADAVAGTPLQIGSPLVSGPVTGGRFYGFSNVTFSVYVASALLLTGAVTQLLVDDRRRSAAVAAAVALGAVATLVVGWPTFGADFGGILAMLPGFAYLVTVLAGARLTGRRVGGFLLAAVAAAGLVAVLDWMRPASERSHFGGFVQKVLDGEAAELVLRKAAAALGSLASPAGVFAALVVAAAIAAVLRPGWLGGLSLRPVYSRWQLLPSVLRATAAVAVLGSLVNDSGIVIAVTMLLTIAPLLAAVLLAESASEPRRQAPLPAPARLASGPA